MQILYIVFYIQISEINLLHILEKMQQLCTTILLYVKSIDRRLKTLDFKTNSEENKNIFDTILPIESLESLKAFEVEVQNNEMKSHFVSKHLIISLFVLIKLFIIF